MAKVLVACEYSGRMRDAFIAEGHDAMSCDFLPTEQPGPHYQGDVRDVLDGDWDAMVAHPTCTRLANSGVRWLHQPPPGFTVDDMREQLMLAAQFYLVLRRARIRFKAIENPVMHCHARMLLGDVKRHVVQPWWFGDPAFKATGWELHGLPPLKADRRLTPPPSGTPEHRRWSAVHRAPPGPERWKFRSRSFPGMCRAAARQWGRAMSCNG